MTIRELIAKGKLEKEVFVVRKHSHVNVRFITNDGSRDEVQLDVHENVLTEQGETELTELFESLCEEFNTTPDSVEEIIIVASEATPEKLEEFSI